MPFEGQLGAIDFAMSQSASTLVHTLHGQRTRPRVTIALPPLDHCVALVSTAALREVANDRRAGEPRNIRFTYARDSPEFASEPFRGRLSLTHAEGLHKLLRLYRLSQRQRCRKRNRLSHRARVERTPYEQHQESHDPGTLDPSDDPHGGQRPPTADQRGAARAL